MRRKCMPWPVAVLVLLLALVASAEPTASDGTAMTPDLRPRFVQGRGARYEFWTLRDQDITLNLNGQSQAATTRMEVTGQATWAVERVKPDGSASCVMTLDWIVVTLTTADGATLNNDSRRASGDSEQIHQMLRAMAGVPVRIDVAADGTIRGAAGVEAVRRRAGADLRVPDELDFMETAADLATIPVAPAQALPGRSWDYAALWNHDMGKLQAQTRYALVGVEEIAGIPVATVAGASSLRLEPDMSKFPKTGPDGSPAPRIDIKLTAGKAATQVLFDLQRHEAVGRNTTQETQIETRVRYQSQAITRTSREFVQSQALRLDEW